MFKKKDSIDRMRIASPCSMNWEGMTGDNRARYCDLCNLHVYNISEMTNKEVKTLIANTEGRICARLYKRADGTVITRDCPVGLRAIRRRVSRVASVTIAAIFGICTGTFGKTSPTDFRPGSSRYRISGMNVGIASRPNHSEIAGRVVDPNGAAIESAKVTITNQNTGMKSKAETKADGTFQFSMLQAGLYTIEIEAPGFSLYQISDIKLGASDTYKEDIELDVSGATVGIIVLDEPSLTSPGPGRTTVFSEKQIRSLPF